MIHHIAIKHGDTPPSNEENTATMLYCGNTLKEAVEQLNKEFIKLKKDGKTVQRVSISKFTQH